MSAKQYYAPCNAWILRQIYPGSQLGLAVLIGVRDVGRDAPFVNNYGVWEDEFKELGLRDTLEYIWPDALCYFGEDREVGVPTTPLTLASEQ